MTYNEKCSNYHFRKTHMEQLNLITNFLRIEDKNITITDEYDMGTHLELHGHLDDTAPKCPKWKGQMAKYDYQKTSKIPYLETAGYPLLIRLRKRRFKCKDCGKMAVAETPLVKKNHQISVAVNQKIAQLLIENQAMKHIAHRLSISTSSVMRKLNEFKFETDWNTLPEVMSWDEYAFKKGKMSFIAQDFDSLNVIAILDGRTQATIRNHFLRYPRKVRNRVKVITMAWICLVPIINLLNSFFRMQKLYSTAFISCNTLVVLWTVSVFKLWINSTEHRRNTEPWNVTGNWYNKIVVNSAINDFIDLCFECIWLTRKYSKNSCLSPRN